MKVGQGMWTTTNVHCGGSLLANCQPSVLEKLRATHGDYAQSSGSARIVEAGRTLSWQHHCRGPDQIHCPHRPIFVHDYDSMAKVFKELNPIPGNDGARSMSFPLLWQSISLLPLPGAPPQGALWAAMWAMDYGLRVEQFEIHGGHWPGHACFSFSPAGSTSNFLPSPFLSSPTMSPLLGDHVSLHS